MEEQLATRPSDDTSQFEAAIVSLYPYDIFRDADCITLIERDQ